MAEAPIDPLLCEARLNELRSCFFGRSNDPGTELFFVVVSISMSDRE